MFFVLLLAAFANAERHTIAHTHTSLRDHHRHGWDVDLKSDVAADRLHNFFVMLKHDDARLAKFDEFFDSVSDPKHALYGQHATRREIEAMLHSSERHDRVVAWLRAGGVAAERIGSHGDVLRVTATTREIESLFAAKMRHMKELKAESSRVLARVHGSLSVPAELRDDVEFVAGLTELFPARMLSSSEARATRTTRNANNLTRRCANCAEITPQALRKYYNISASLHASGLYDNKQSVGSFGEKFSAKALAAFGKYVANSSFPFVISNIPGGAINPANDEGEGDLDVQYILATGQNVPTWFWNSFDGLWILQWAFEVGQTQSPPLVHSLSYGTSIQSQCAIASAWCQVLGYNSSAYVARTNRELQKLGAQGLTVLISSGDNGAPGRANNGFCPLDDNIYCPLGGCAHNATACQGIELTISYDAGNATMNCILPMGDQGFACQGLTSILAVGNSNISALYNLVQNVLNYNLSIADAAWEFDIQGNPHLYLPTGNDCASIAFDVQFDAGTLNIQGYVFDLKDTRVGQTFIDEFPGSSPYVTSVGMSTINDLSKPELVGTILNGGIVTGGGGFSIQNAQLKHQTKFVQNYLRHVKKLLPPSAMYDSTKRAYPDISLTGERYVVFGELNNGSLATYIVSGTSASSPALAGLISLINEQRLADGASPVGFLNPLLYQAASDDPTIFNDISQGGNNACTDCYCCKFGWPASTGFDLATGLGSPNFGRLYDYATN